MQPFCLKLFLFLKCWFYILRDHLKQSLLAYFTWADSFLWQTSWKLWMGIFLQTSFYTFLHKHTKIHLCWMVKRCTDSLAGAMYFWMFLTCILLYFFVYLLNRLLSHLQDKKKNKNMLKLCAVLELCRNSLPLNWSWGFLFAVVVQCEIQGAGMLLQLY